MIANYEVVSRAKELLAQDIKYLYGAKMEKMTDSKYYQLKSMYGDLVWDSDIKKVGKTCTDCSGLVSYCTDGVIHNSKWYKSYATASFDISSIESAIPGCAVYRDGHIGIYIGNYKVIEARSSRYNIVESDVRERDFTSWFFLPNVDYVFSISGTAESAKLLSVKNLVNSNVLTNVKN